MKKIITIAAFVLMVLALCIACQNGDNTEYTIYTTTTNGTIKLSSKTAKVKETIQITAAPSSSAYQLVKGSVWVVSQNNTISVSTASESADQGKYSFKMPAANVVVSVSFSKISSGEPLPPLTKNQIFSGGEFNNAVLTGYNNRHVPWYCDDEGRRQGTQAIRVGPDEFSDNGAGFSIKRNAGSAINLSEVKALSFWARSPDAIRVQSVGFGTDTTAGNTYSVTYTGENDSGIAIGSEWERYLIPIPSSKSASVDGVFTLQVNRREASRTLYIDDIEYVTATVSLANIVLPEPDTISVAEPTPFSRITLGMKALYTVDGTTISLFAGNVNFASYHTYTYNVAGGGVSLNNSTNTVTAATLGGTYTLSVTLDSVSKQVSGHVSPARFITIEDCMPAGVGLIEGNSNTAGPGGYRASSWDAVFDTANGKPYLKVLNRRWDGNRDWDREGTVGRNLPTALDLTSYTKIILSVRAQSVGLGFHFRIWQGATEPPDPNEPTRDPARHSTVALPVTNLWQEVEIPLSDSFKNSERGDSGGELGARNDIRRWEIATDYNNFNENDLYIGFIRASQ